MLTRYLALSWLLLGFSATAAAQETGGSLTVEIAAATTEINFDEAVVACADADGGAAIAIRLLRRSDINDYHEPLLGEKIKAWWLSDAATECTDPGTNPFHSAELTETDVTAVTAETGFTFPDDLAQKPTGGLTEKTVLGWLAGCDTDGGVLPVDDDVRLCIAVDPFVDTPEIDQYPLETVFVAWVVFVVDTDPPPAPILGDNRVVPRDGSVTLKPAVGTDGNSDDIVSWRVHSRVAEETTGACTDWPVAASVTGASAPEIDIGDLTNSQEYEFCVVATDDLDNDSEPSAVVSVSPRDECDFIECYPGELNSGYCSASNAPLELWALLLAGLSTLWLRRRS